MEDNCEKQEDEKEQYERDGMQEESLQSKAKAVVDCIVQAQEWEMVEAGRESGVDEESVHVTKKNMDALLRKVKQLSEMAENAGRLVVGSVE